jgi:hypothetical protein
LFILKITVNLFKPDLARRLLADLSAIFLADLSAVCWRTCPPFAGGPVRRLLADYLCAIY